MSTSENQFRPHPSVVHTRLDSSEAVLLHLKTKQYYSLNEVGSRIWELLQTSTGPTDISNTLQKEYEIEHEALKKYVADFLEELQQEGLVQTGNA